MTWEKDPGTKKIRLAEKMLEYILKNANKGVKFRLSAFDALKDATNDEK